MSKNPFQESNAALFLAQAMASFEPGDMERDSELSTLRAALKQAEEEPEPYPIMLALENRSKAFEAAEEAKDWELINRHSAAHLNLIFRLASVQRNPQTRAWAQQALADRLELVEQLEAHLPGLKAREWGLYLRAKHFDLMFR